MCCARILSFIFNALAFTKRHLGSKLGSILTPRRSAQSSPRPHEARLPRTVDSAYRRAYISYVMLLPRITIVPPPKGTRSPGSSPASGASSCPRIQAKKKPVSPRTRLFPPSKASSLESFGRSLDRQAWRLSGGISRPHAGTLRPWEDAPTFTSPHPLPRDKNTPGRGLPPGGRVFPCSSQSRPPGRGFFYLRIEKPRRWEDVGA